MKRTCFWLLLLSAGCLHLARAAEISLTFDDFNVDETTLIDASARNQKILQTLDHHGLKAALFVQAKYIDTHRGMGLLSEWDKKGHLIGNHTYSHLSYSSPDVSFTGFVEDLLKAENLLKPFQHFEKMLRFPYLHEGETRAKRDQMRHFLKEWGYRVGHVTIDASDWYINDRMVERIHKDPHSDLQGYRAYFLKHIWDRAQFYDGLSRKVLGREVKHTVLLHYNLLNALYLEDLIQFFQKKGWKVISATEAFKDPIFKEEPEIVPAGNSIIWARAKATGKYDAILRDPGEDGDYEKEAMDQLGL